MTIPLLWEGRLAALARPESIGFVIGAVARALARHPNGDDEDRFLVRAQISIDRPMRDRVWIDVAGHRSLRAFVARLDLERGGLARWSSSIAYDYTGSFDVDPTEFRARCLPHYHGFLHSWTDENTAREQFATWPRERQASFQHEYLLYAANDARTQPDDALQRAAAWLLDHRRYALRWTLTARATPIDHSAHDDGSLLEALATFTAAVRACSDAVWLVALCDEVEQAIRVPADSELLDVLSRLECDDGRRRLHIHEVVASFAWGITSSIEPRIAPAFRALQQTLDDVARWAW